MLFRTIMQYIIIFLIIFYKKLFNKKRTKNVVLINWNGKLGDAIISSFFIKKLIDNNYVVSVITRKNLYQLYKENYKINNLFIVDKPSYINLLRLKKYISADVVVTLFGRLSNIDLFFILLYPSAIIFTSDIRLQKICPLNLQNIKIWQIYKNILKYFNINSSNYKYIIPLSNIKKQKESHFILFNPFGSRMDKSLSIDRSAELLNKLTNLYPNKIISLISTKETLSSAEQIILKCINSFGIKLKLVNDIYELFDLINNSSNIISVDTSVAHIASSLNKKCIIIYRIFNFFNPWELTQDYNTKIVYSKTYKQKSISILNIDRIIAYVKDFD